MPVAAPVPMTAPAPRAAVPAPVMPPMAMPVPQPPITYVPPAAVTPVPGATQAMQSATDRRKAPAMVFDASPAQSPLLMVAPPAPGDAPKKPGTAAAQGQGDNEQFAARVGGEDGNLSTAVAMSNPATTVTQGTLIPAVLETAINTDLPGYVRAMVSRDVKSFDGSAVLIPRSSRLIGQYKSGLAAGQTRAYIIWQRLIRPDGVSVALGSPGIDFAGEAGMAGKVDSHFMKRFGSAMLLSVVGGLGAIGSGGASVVLSSGGQSAASVAASRDAQIAPTVRVRQGEPIRIFTARDLDFSGFKG